MLANMFFYVLQIWFVLHIAIMIKSVDLSQETLAIDVWTALKFSLQHGRKHVLRFLRKDRKHRLENMFLSFPAVA